MFQKPILLLIIKEIPEVIIISQYYHITRCKLAMKNVDINNAQGVHANIFELNDFFSIVREFFGYYKYLIFY